ncbi:MAG: NAD-dependent DNA ligase LigA [Lachnospiraceae bacterium]
MEASINRMKELIAILNPAAKAYYQENREIMSNQEYDIQYDELQALERETGMVLAGSPTSFVGYEVLSELTKETHITPMLSLDKTKDPAVLQAWMGQQTCMISWKLDGLTIVLTYREGSLQKAVTRGNGTVGEVVTANAKTFKNIPLKIPFQGELILRGEAVIHYSDFEAMNHELDTEAKYKNPRNLCSGSVRQLNSEITAQRNVHFYAFTLVSAEGIDFENSKMKQMEWLRLQGFSVVPYRSVQAENLEETIQSFAEEIKNFDIPSDGLVLFMDDIAYGESLGSTAKFPRNGMAFKWADEMAETTLREIEWSPSRTGLLNPVAIFDAVELEGSTVSRASVHNLSVMEGLQLGIGDTIKVYKSNMIIPQIAENLTKSGNILIPKICPVCGGDTRIEEINEVRTLYCSNPSCIAKKIKAFELFVSRDAMNIDGLSEATMEKMIGAGFVKNFADIYRLSEHREAIVQMEGFGERSYENMIKSIEKSQNTTMPRVIYALGVPGIGVANAKMICKAFGHEINRLRALTSEELLEVDGIGTVLADAWVHWFADETNIAMLDDLLHFLKIEIPEISEKSQLWAGKTFVITGSVEIFKNRNEMKAYIEARGGKVSASVSSKTHYLINNDLTSNSSKNKKAKELGIPIRSEKNLIEGDL